MSDTVLSGDFTVYYEAENRQKRLVYTGAGAMYTTKALYLALMTLFADNAQMDDGVPMSAQTPTEFTIGKIDAGDDDPWFIDPESVQYLKGGALKTDGWLRVTDSNTGIVRIDVTAATAIVAGDIGLDITHADGDAGTLLAIQDLTGGVKVLWIRPDTSAIANNWDSTGGVVTVNTHTGTQGTGRESGENLWANIYNTGIATLLADTHLYIYQGVQSGDTAPDALVVEYDLSKALPQDWWADGTFDVLALVADLAADLKVRANFLDEGYITVFARQYTGTYSFYIVDLFAGGRNPIPLEIGNDLNSATGYAQVTLVGSSGNFNAGDEVEGAISGARAILTGTSGAHTTMTLQFYYIGKAPFTVFNGSEIIANNDDTGNSTSSGAVSDYGPATLVGLSIAFGADETHDVDDSGVVELYSIVLDCSDELLVDVYEWAKWRTRRGDITTSDTNGIEGEQYIGNDVHLNYSGLAGGVWAEGNVVYGQTTGARGTIVADHAAADELILRNTRGTFLDTEVIGDAATGPTVTADVDTVRSITPVKACPFGIFAGGKWFLAPGVVLDNRAGADANNYECTDDLGTTGIAEPVQVTLLIGNTRIKDWVSLLRLDGVGGVVEKDYYNIDVGGLGHLKGHNLVKVTPNIRIDEPGKGTGGVVVIYDISAGVEHVYHYSSWSGDEFTLDQTAAGTATGGDTDTLIDAGASFLTTLKVGMIVRDTATDDWAYVISITDNTTAEMTTKASTWSGKAYVANDLVEDYVAGDFVYVPLLHRYETAGTNIAPGNESTTMVYNGTVYSLLRGRQAGGSYNIKPFSVAVSVGAGGLSQNLIRNPETITT